ncbi:aldolase/citrate lyase family protein [Aliamphritea hakodatensis]|uniref:aldolase/citrate lyase family protein n=1 Tax=Aliamphritea hakodatensis TaxID=2895352 RepID=UPI0022FD6000|nr:aldolase/citrate lyase family protein [Aliamphritea hakodatensis]
MITFMLITNSVDIASYAESCGVGRIFVDLERIGKFERQGHLDTVISQHSIHDVENIKKSLRKAELLVRLNPLHSDTANEIDQSIEAGADLLMLPMYRDAEEVKRFTELVNGRAAVVPLLETYDAAKCIDDVVNINGVSEIYIGLNDLHIDMGLSFIFEPLAMGLVEDLAKKISGAGLKFGFGGIARVGEGAIPGEMVLAEHLRLGSSSVILSRTFHRNSDNMNDFNANINLGLELAKLREAERCLALRKKAECEADFNDFRNSVQSLVLNKGE